MNATSSANVTLLRSLQNPALYNHPTQDFEIIETHISWILLTGEYAYKIKKPVNLGFLDFSTLEKRHHYCTEELRLNQRLAPQIYLEVITITGNADAPVLGGLGAPIEYAVKMRQFPQSAQLDRMVACGELKPTHIDQLAEVIAAFHGRTAIAEPDTLYGRPVQVHQPVMENFAQIRPHLTSATDIGQLEKLRAWSDAEFHRHEEIFKHRKNNRFIRECHGDMHLGNMALLEGSITLFDCLEFNENLRWIDVTSEIAFLIMDLNSRTQSALAWRFLNAYLQLTGDYAGLRVLRYYLVYRALVRAKVACIRLAQTLFNPAQARFNPAQARSNPAQMETSQQHPAYQQYKDYVNLAERYIQRNNVPLIITHGLSGSGKTTHTQSLLESLGAIRLRSDVERKRLAHLPSQTRSSSGVDAGLYTAAASQRTYEYLADLARTVIQSGYPAIIDAAFLKHGPRDLFHRLADSLGVPFIILDFQAPEAVLRARITQRMHEGHDASEADLVVLTHQLTNHEPLTGEETAYTLTITADQPLAPIQAIEDMIKTALHYE